MRYIDLLDEGKNIIDEMICFHATQLNEIVEPAALAVGAIIKLELKIQENAAYICAGTPTFLHGSFFSHNVEINSGKNLYFASISIIEEALRKALTQYAALANVAARADIK